MIKGTVFIALFALLILPVVSAVSTDMKQSYQPGETIVTQVSGNILEPILAAQVSFLRGHVKVPFDYEVKKLGNSYFIWALAPLNVSQNYTLLIEDVVTTVNGQRQTVDFMQNFSVSGNITSYAVRPGAILANKDFELVVTLYEDNPRVVSIDFPYVRDITLQPGTNILQFSTSDVAAGTQTMVIHLGKYAIPAQITGNGTGTSPGRSQFNLDPGSISRQHYYSEKSVVYVVNARYTGVKKLSDVKIVYNDNILSVRPASIKTLEPNTTIVLNVTVLRPGTRNISEIIYIQSEEGNFSRALPIEVMFIANTSTASNRSNSTLYRCPELSGVVCSYDQVCQGTLETSLDGACCIGSCILADEGSSKAWIGYLIGAIVVIVGLFIFLRYKKVRNEKNPLDKKIAAAEKKINLP